VPAIPFDYEKAMDHTAKKKKEKKQRMEAYEQNEYENILYM